MRVCMDSNSQTSPDVFYTHKMLNLMTPKISINITNKINNILYYLFVYSTAVLLYFRLTYMGRRATQ